MKKLLIIAPQNPYPAKDGGKIGIYYPIIHLAKYFQVHFVFITPDAVSKDVYGHFENAGVTIYPQVVTTNDTPQGYLFNFLEKLPYKFNKYYSETVYRRVAAIVKEQQISSVWCNHPHVARYAIQLKKDFKIRIYLREHNIEYSLVQQVAQVNSNPLLKMFVGYQFRKTRNFEVDCWRTFDQVYFISRTDFSQATQEAPGQKNFRLLYDSFQKMERKPSIVKEPFSFIFTASLTTFQNAYNLTRFVKEVWLPLFEEHPENKLYLTGNNDEVIKKALKINYTEFGIYNLGFVDDIGEAIQSKKYFVSPSYVGSGVRIKVLNALNLGAVCFVTPLDVGMLDVLKDQENIVRFSDYKEFAANLAKLEKDEKRYNYIALNASHVGANFTWTNYAEIINNDINED